jgi:uncharacterized protein (TIGR02145 family)
MEDYPQKGPGSTPPSYGSRGLGEIAGKVATKGGMVKILPLLASAGVISAVVVTTVVVFTDDFDNTPLLPYDQKEVNAYCKAYLTTPDDTTLENYQWCKEFSFCDQFQKDPSREKAQPFVDVYQGKTDSTCYKNALRRLDELDCEEAKNATNKLPAYEAYLDKYGNYGICSKAFEEEMVACEALRGETNCDAYEAYLARFGERGLCSVSTRIFLREEKCLIRADSMLCEQQIEGLPCQILLQRYFNFDLNLPDTCLATAINTLQECSYDCQDWIQNLSCNALQSYLDIYGKSGICYLEILERQKRLCAPPPPKIVERPPPPVTNAVKIGGLWVMRENIGLAGASSDYQAKYGRFYSWSLAQKANVCPKGWRLPCKSEIDYLLAYYKEPYSSLTSERTDRANLQLNGKLDVAGKVSKVGSVGYYWTSTSTGRGAAWAVEIDRSTEIIKPVTIQKKEEASCRCVAEAIDYGDSPWLKQSGCGKNPIQ